MPIDVVAIEQWKRVRTDRDDLSGNVKIRLFLLGGHVTQEHNEISKQVGILGSELLILFALRRSGSASELRPTDLLKSLLVPSATMARHLNQLEKLKLVKRRNNPNDRRGYLFKLTLRGMQVADKALEISHKTSFIDTALSSFTKKEKAALDQMLAKLLSKADAPR